VFAGFPVFEIDLVMRRTLRSAVVAAVLAIVAAFQFGQPLVAPGVVIGLALALVNHRVFQATALHFTSEEGKIQRKPFAGSVFLRLGGCTVVALLLLVFVRPVGWGVIGGLAVFQALMLVNAIVALIAFQRSDAASAAGGGDA
jgi:hypothetical protein